MLFLFLCIFVSLPPYCISPHSQKLKIEFYCIIKIKVLPLWHEKEGNNIQRLSLLLERICGSYPVQDARDAFRLAFFSRFPHSCIRPEP